MIIALMMGKKRSKGFPNKNIKKILGRQLCEYPLIACKNSKYVNRTVVCNGAFVVSKKVQINLTQFNFSLFKMKKVKSVSTRYTH